jgi:hypothetical protein
VLTRPPIAAAGAGGVDVTERRGVVDRPGAVVRDYQIVRMGQPHMKGPMWWHDGQRIGTMERAGGEPERTVPMERPLTCDFAATPIVALLDGAPFDPGTILAALREPVFPLGRRGYRQPSSLSDLGSIHAGGSILPHI